MPSLRAIAPKLAELHKSRDDIAVVKVDINRPGVKGIDWSSPVAQQYKLHSIPHFKIFARMENSRRKGMLRTTRWRLGSNRRHHERSEYRGLGRREARVDVDAVVAQILRVDLPDLVQARDDVVAVGRHKQLVATDSRRCWRRQWPRSPCPSRAGIPR